MVDLDKDHVKVAASSSVAEIFPAKRLTAAVTVAPARASSFAEWP